MPDIIPYTAGTDMASAAGAAMGRASAPGPIGSFMQGFQPGFNAFIGDVRDDRKKQKKIDQNRKFLADLEAKNPDLSNKKWWPYVHGVGDEGGDVNKALFQGIELDRHEKDQADSMEIKRLLADSQIERRQSQTENDKAKTNIYGESIDSQNRRREFQSANDAYRADTTARNVDSQIENRGGLIDLGRDRLAETGRHNAATEATALQNANRPRGGKTPEQHDLDQAVYEDHAATQMVKDAESELKAVLKDSRDPNVISQSRSALFRAKGQKSLTADAVREARKKAAMGSQGVGNAAGPSAAPSGQDFNTYFDSLPSGAEFTDPETGQKRRKR